MWYVQELRKAISSLSLLMIYHFMLTLPSGGCGRDVPSHKGFWMASPRRIVGRGDEGEEEGERRERKEGRGGREGREGGGEEEERWRAG